MSFNNFTEIMSKYDNKNKKSVCGQQNIINGQIEHQGNGLVYLKASE